MFDTAIESPIDRQASRYAPVAAALVMGQAVVKFGIGVMTSTIDPQSHDPASPSFYSWGAVLTAMHVLLLVGVAYLVISRAGGRTVLAGLAYTVVLAGVAMQAVAEAVLRFSFSTGNALFGVVVPATALGFILLGVAIIRARTWAGWHRLVPLACGLYVPLVLLPAFGAAHGVSFPALAGWQVLFFLLGVAMWRESRGVTL